MTDAQLAQLITSLITIVGAIATWLKVKQTSDVLHETKKKVDATKTTIDATDAKVDAAKEAATATSEQMQTVVALNTDQLHLLNALQENVDFRNRTLACEVERDYLLKQIAYISSDPEGAKLMLQFQAWYRDEYKKPKKDS